MTKRQPLPRAGISDAEREEIEASGAEFLARDAEDLGDRKCDGSSRRPGFSRSSWA